MRQSIACKHVPVVTCSVLFTHKTIETDEVTTRTLRTCITDH